MLMMWGTWSYFDATGCAWRFDGKLAVPPLTAENSDVLQMAREAFNRPSGRVATRNYFPFSALRNRGTDERGLHARCSDSCPGILQAGDSRSSKWEAWLPHLSHWRPLRGGLGGNEEFESASIEVNTESSKWLQIIVNRKLGKNKAGKQADATQARAAHSPSCIADPHQVCSPTQITIVLTGPRRKGHIVPDLKSFFSHGRERLCRQAQGKRARVILNRGISRCLMSGQKETVRNKF